MDILVYLSSSHWKRPRRAITCSVQELQDVKSSKWQGSEDFFGGSDFEFLFNTVQMFVDQQDFFYMLDKDGTACSAHLVSQATPFSVYFRFAQGKGLVVRVLCNTCDITSKEFKNLTSLYACVALRALSVDRSLKSRPSRKFKTTSSCALRSFWYPNRLHAFSIASLVAIRPVVWNSISTRHFYTAI